MRNRLLVALLLSASPALAQVSPAQMGVTPTTTPEVLQTLDNTKTWVPVGRINPALHTFVGVGAALDVQQVGMLPGGQDNSPLVPALMAAIGPVSANNGIDVNFSARVGQAVTEYYFTSPLVLSRGAQYHCGSTTPSPSVYLLFAPGIDGVIQESSSQTSDGGQGVGMVTGCNIRRLDYGSATANPVTPNVLTGASFVGDPAGVLPLTAWHVGDGILLSAYKNSVMPVEAIPAAPLGTTITAIGAMGGDGNPATQQNVTLSNPVSQFLGASADLGSGLPPKATATFTETGANNFVANDAVTVGKNTYTFRSASMVGIVGAYTVATGVDFATSAANLVAAIKNTAGQLVTYIPNTVGPQGLIPNPDVTASYASGVITFTSNYSGPGANTIPVSYAPAGVPAGSFSSATLSGANNAASCLTPCTVQNVDVRFWQLPASQAYRVQTTVGSNSVTLISGPRPLRVSDVVISDAFPFGTTVYTATATGFPETVTMTNPADTGGAQNATVSHAAGSEGNLWIMPALLKRRTVAEAEHNVMSYAPIGEQMTCSNGSGLNCDLSRDKGNWHQVDFVGRWSAGNNYSTSSSFDEQFSDNMLTDIWEGGTLGQVYVNPNMESPESGSAKYGFLMNCSNQNATAIFGTYAGAGSPNACAYQIPANDWTIYPPQPGGPLLIGQLASGYNGPTLQGSVFSGIAGFRVVGGADNIRCTVLGGGAINWYNFAVSTSNCSTNTTMGLGWNISSNSWDWLYAGASASVMKYAVSGLGYTGYTGIGFGTAFPYGAILGGDNQFALYANWRLLGMSTVKPVSNWHAQGNTTINTVALPGGQAAWFMTASFSTTLTGAVTKGTTTSVTVAACPPAALPNTTLISDTTASPPLSLGFQTSCTAGTLTFTAAALNNANSGDAIKFLQHYVAAPISNDPVNPDYTMTAIRSGSSANRDIAGRQALVGGTYAYTLLQTYATAPICFCADVTTPATACSANETTTVVTFTAGAGTDTIKWQCVGRN